ncbi:MAG: hypothetical protein ACJ8D2_04835, partial [Sphingomicrobium sp.]
MRPANAPLPATFRKSASALPFCENAPSWIRQLPIAGVIAEAAFAGFGANLFGGSSEAVWTGLEAAFAGFAGRWTTFDARTVFGAPDEKAALPAALLMVSAMAAP